MSRATIHLEVVTPCFLGGADQKSAEWRAASIRGQLRWWFRAVAGGELEGDLATTRAEEAAVFGSTEQRSNLRVQTTGLRPEWGTGRRWPGDQRKTAEKLAELAGLSSTDEPGVVERLRIVQRGKDGTEFEVTTDPLQYLGYGCIGWDKDQRCFVQERSCFAPGQRAQVHLQWRGEGPGGLSEQGGRLLARALWAWLHLGGIGSRSRNGYGSLGVVGIDGALPGGTDLSLAPSLEGLCRAAGNLLGRAENQHTAEWSHFSSKSRILISRSAFYAWDDALCAAGAWVLTFRRRYGSPLDRRTLDGNSLANRDYVWAREASGGGLPGGFPDKAGFGLPLMFDKQGAAVTWLPKKGGEGGREDSRRASPLLIHIAKLGPRSYYPVLTYLPARMLPPDGELRFRRRQHRTFHLRDQPRGRPGPQHESVVGSFLDGLKAQGVVQEVAL